MLNLPFEPVDFKKIDPKTFELLPLDFIKQKWCIALRYTEGTLTLGLTDPANVFLIR